MIETPRRPIRSRVLVSLLKIDRLSISVVTLVSGLCLLSGFMLLTMRLQTREDGVKASRNVVVAESLAINRSFSTYKAILESTVSAFDDPALAQAGPRLQQLALFNAFTGSKDLGPLRLIDFAGKVLRDSSSPEPAEASQFELAALEEAKRSKSDQPFLSGLNASTKGEVEFTMPIRARDGAVTGIVTSSISLRHFTEEFRQLSLGPDDVVSLFTADGTMLAHIPGNPEIGRSIAGSDVLRHFQAARAGTFAAHSASDGVFRLFSFTHVGDMPLILDVGLSESDMYAPWHVRVVIVGSLLCIMTGLAAIMLWMLRVEVRKKVRGERIARASETRYRLLADRASDLILRVDSHLVQTYVSPSCMKFGYTSAELLGTLIERWIHKDDVQVFHDAIRSISADQSDVETSYRFRHKNGYFLWTEVHLAALEDGGYVGVLRNIDERKKAEVATQQEHRELTHLARIDSLTELSNRRAFDEALQTTSRVARREGKTLSLLMLDVDRFKAYNDRYGHQAGDVILKSVADLIGTSLKRAGDLAARYGGEEFGIVLPNTDVFGAIVVAHSIRDAIVAARLKHEASEFGCVTVSIGGATVHPALGDFEPADILAAADANLYRAKTRGRNEVRVEVVSCVSIQSNSSMPRRIM